MAKFIKLYSENEGTAELLLILNKDLIMSYMPLDNQAEIIVGNMAWNIHTKFSFGDDIPDSIYYVDYLQRTNLVRGDELVLLNESSSSDQDDESD